MTEIKHDIPDDKLIDEKFNLLAKGEQLNIEWEKPDLRAALRVIEKMIIEGEIGPSTRPSEIRDLIASELKKIEDL